MSETIRKGWVRYILPQRTLRGAMAEALAEALAASGYRGGVAKDFVLTDDAIDVHGGVAGVVGAILGQHGLVPFRSEAGR